MCFLKKIHLQIILVLLIRLHSNLFSTFIYHMRKRILVISAVFPPEQVTSALMNCDLARALSKDYEVTVLRPYPTRPIGMKFDYTGMGEEPFQTILVESYTHPQSELMGRFPNSYSNVFYHGAFRSPADLPTVYDSFDITVSCYQVSSLNERIAEPNKLYESLFFYKPIVVSDGIYLATRVKELGCGYCILADTEESIKDFVSSLEASQVKEVSVHTSQIDLKEIVNDQSPLNKYIVENAFNPK